MKLPFLLIWKLLFFTVVQCRCPCTLLDGSVSCDFGSISSFPSDLVSKCPDIIANSMNIESLDLQGIVFNLFNLFNPQEVTILKLVKFMLSKKATKIDEIFTADLTLFSKSQIHDEDFVNFCGLLQKHDL